MNFGDVIDECDFLDVVVGTICWCKLRSTAFFIASNSNSMLLLRVVKFLIVSLISNNSSSLAANSLNCTTKGSGCTAALFVDTSSAAKCVACSNLCCVGVGVIGVSNCPTCKDDNLAAAAAPRGVGDGIESTELGRSKCVLEPSGENCTCSGDGETDTDLKAPSLVALALAAPAAPVVTTGMLKLMPEIRFFALSVDLGDRDPMLNFAYPFVVAGSSSLGSPIG